MQCSVVCVVNTYRVYKAYFTQVYRNPDIYIYVKIFYRKLMHKMPILHRDNCYILVGRILLFVWDAHFYVGMSTLIVKTGKISLIAWDAHIYCEIGHPDADIYVNIGIGVPIFA